MWMWMYDRLQYKTHAENPHCMHGAELCLIHFPFCLSGAEILWLRVERRKTSVTPRAGNVDPDWLTFLC